ncbi:MAG: formate transporter FocA [Bowdeniella nasicola]|nr:formate transporter FocA [Bowdeniella nasicola]
MSINPPPEIINVAEDGLLKKAYTPFGATFISAMYAGAMIAVGFVFFTTSQMGITDQTWVGLTKVIGGIVFSTGLALVVMTGSDLFTSTSMTLIPGCEGKLPWSRLLQHWGVVYVGNFVGSVLIAILVFLGGLPAGYKGAWGATVMNIATAKVSHPFFEALVLGIMCNFMVCLAVWMTFAGKSVADKILGLTMPIALFVASGFEHSVANMFMIPLGLIVKGQGDPAIIEATGKAIGEFDGLTIGTFLINNLLPVTIGNIIGGGVFVGLGMWLWHRRLANTAQKVAN